MTRDDIAIMLGTMREIYGTKSDGSDPKMMIELWYRYLCDEPKAVVQMAFDQHVAGNVYAPKPAEILELIEKIKWRMYSETLYVDPFDGEQKQLPAEYLPRQITRRPKQFEVFNKKRLMSDVDQKVKLLAEKLALK